MHAWWPVSNVAGQSVVPILVAAREKTLDLEMYNNPRDLEDDDEPTPPVISTHKAPERETVSV